MRVSRRVLAAIVVAFTLTSTLPVRAADPTRAPVGVDVGQIARLANNSGPIAVEGQLVDSRGRPSSGTIQAFAWPTEAVLSKIRTGAPVQKLAVSAARVGTDGRFSLRLARSLLPADYVSANGQVDLELIAWSASAQRRWFVSVRSDSAGGEPVWVLPVAPKNLSASSAADKRVNAAIALTEPLQAAPAQQSGPTPNLPVCPPSVLISTHNVYVLIGRSMNNESGQTSWMHDGSSHSVTLGVAVSSQSAIGYSASGTSSTTTGVDFTWAGSSSDRRYYVQTQYGKYRFVCAGVVQYTFKPRVPTGGFTQSTSSFNAAWSNCAPVSPGTWTRVRTDGNTTKFGAGVEAAGHIGINLSFESNYSSTRTLNYKLTLTGRVCGSNNLPSLASEVEAEW